MDMGVPTNGGDHRIAVLYCLIRIFAALSDDSRFERTYKVATGLKRNKRDDGEGFGRVVINRPVQLGPPLQLMDYLQQRTGYWPLASGFWSLLPCQAQPGLQTAYRSLASGLFFCLPPTAH
jgi:hypothetical protein